MISADVKVEAISEVEDIDSIVHDLDEAVTEAQAEALNTQASNVSGAADGLERFLVHHHSNSILIMLRLTLWERLKWSIGKKLTNTEIAKRIYSYLDYDKKDFVHTDLLEVLGKCLQGEIMFNQKATETIEV
jgi:hypothetical protein